MDQIYELLAITLGAILANNFIFSQFLGICPFLGVPGGRVLLARSQSHATS